MHTVLVGLNPLAGLGEQEAVDAHKHEDDQVHVQRAQEALGEDGVDNVDEDERAGDPHEGHKGVHMLGGGDGLLGDLVGGGLHIGLGGDVAQLHQLIGAGTGEQHQQNEHHGQMENRMMFMGL